MRSRWAAPLVLVAVAAALVVVPAAGAEPAASKAKRLPAGFIDVGFGHSCAILDTGRVRCWGLATDGQLGYASTGNVGDNEKPSSAGPVKLGSKRQARALTLGYFHTCAILDTGRVRCWGLGTNGRLGYGNTAKIGDNETPASVGPVSLGKNRRAIAISAGGNHTCAILDNGRVRCWGAGAPGTLGYGNTNDIGDNEKPGSVGPVSLGANRKAVAIAAGGSHTCVILDTGAVRCWGLGAGGRLGYANTSTIGDNETPASVGPVNLGAGRKAVALSAGHAHTCAILDNGRVRCWGEGANGRLGYANENSIGDTETPGSVGPVDLGRGRKAVAIAAGTLHTCALLDHGNVRCWGAGVSGRVGYGNTTQIGDDEAPGTVGPLDLGPGRQAVAIASGGVHSCAVLDNGRIRCWGSSLEGGQLGYGNTNSIGDNETPAAAGPVSAGGLVARNVRPKLSLALKPKRDPSFPYRVRASGSLSGFLADSVTCKGSVRVRASVGGRPVSKRVNVKFSKGRCTYAASLRLGSFGRWQVTASFAGNSSLRARASRARSFQAG